MTNDEMYEWNKRIIAKLILGNELKEDEVNHVAYCLGAAWMHHGMLEEKKEQG